MSCFKYICKLTSIYLNYEIISGTTKTSNTRQVTSVFFRSIITIRNLSYKILTFLIYLAICKHTGKFDQTM